MRGLLIALLAGAAFCQNTSDSTVFESVDVRVSPPSKDPTMRGGRLRGEGYEVHKATMVDLISLAYNMESTRILGGPSWLDWNRFDVVAKAPPKMTRDDLSLMLEKLLTDRFTLVVRKETKAMPAFVLTTGKGKPTMKAASSSGESGCRGVPQNPAAGSAPYLAVLCQNVTMGAFADILNGLGG